MPERITLTPRQGQPVAAEADVRRPSESGRVAKAAAWGLGGLVLGGLSIFIPIAHFVTTWAIPLAGFGMAWWTMSVRAYVERVRGECPSCGKAFDVEGGPMDDPMWVRCPHCKLPLQLTLSG
jgi:hypothetical protein